MCFGFEREFFFQYYSVLDSGFGSRKIAWKWKNLDWPTSIAPFMDLPQLLQLKKGGHAIICGSTDTLVLDFWWCLLWVSKPQTAALICTWWRNMWCTFLEIYLWCDTCWHHGSQAILIHILVNRYWWGSRPGSHSVSPGRRSARYFNS